MNTQGFPTGWNEERIQNVLAHYVQQTEEDAVAEDEAVYDAEADVVYIHFTDN